MRKTKVKAQDYDSGKKRINLSINIEDFESLVLIASAMGIENPGTVATSLLVREIRKEVLKHIPKELPGQQNIFDRKKLK